MCITNHYLTLNTILYVLKPLIIKTTNEAEMVKRKLIVASIWCLHRFISYLPRVGPQPSTLNSPSVLPSFLPSFCPLPKCTVCTVCTAVQVETSFEIKPAANVPSSQPGNQHTLTITPCIARIN